MENQVLEFESKTFCDKVISEKRSDENINTMNQAADLIDT